jgi:predicted Zn-dependent protease
MRHRCGRLTALIAIVVLLPWLAFAQQELSDKDKKKMAEIADRPEVKSRIDDEWAKVRRSDMEYAYAVNTANRFAQMSPTDWATFREKYGKLYDNPILLRYVNSVGQKLVPANSPNLYAFRLLLDPVPRAEALTTGTIFISTGLVSLLDNEAQLAYVLSHEIAHVELKHSYNKIRNGILEEEFAQEKAADQAKKRALFGAIVSAAGAGIGAAAGGGQGALMGAMAGLGASTIAAHFIYRNKLEPTDWSKVNEDEADEAGLKYMLMQNYDAREVPRLYARLDGLVSRDNRVGLGFIGNPERTRERTAQMQKLLSATYKSELDQRMKSPGLVGSSPEFSLLMAALKRDNGIEALDYDLFAMAKDNLQDAAALRSNDPSVQYYLGRVVALTARTDDDKKQAINYFLTAIKYDAERGAYPEPHLEHALYLISQNDATQQDEIKKELKTYVALYQREHGGALPGNMPIIYDYFLLAGDRSWYVAPAGSVSTKYVDALYVNTSVAPSSDTNSMLQREINPAPPAAAPQPTPVSAPKKPPTH